MTTVIDKSAGLPWRDQRDNPWRPHGSCNVTSLRMAADQAGRKCPGDENDFLSFMNEPRWYQEAYRRFKWAWQPLRGDVPQDDASVDWLYPPEQIHDLLEEGFNEWIGAEADRFQMCWTQQELVNAIMRGDGVALSGKFPYRGGPAIKHIVSLAGFETTQPGIVEANAAIVSYVKWWIIDDPYGDFRTEYEVKAGNGVRMSRSDFSTLIRGDGPDCKWAHVVRREL